MAPITRICNLGLLLLGSTAVLAARPAAPSALQSYVQARMAEAQDNGTAARAAYAAALIAEPGNSLIAERALRQAVESGDRDLAVAAAETLAQTDGLPPDASLLLIGIRLQARNLPGATALIDRLETDKKLLFLTPILRSWVGLTARTPNASAQLGVAGGEGLDTGLILEQRALADLLAGRTVEAISLIRSSPRGDARAGVTRITAAATLQKLGDKATAQSLLVGTDASFVAARNRLAANRPIGGAVDTPVRGLAFFYGRLATDLARDNAPRLAMTLARYARFLDPSSPFLAMAEAQSLAANDLNAEALAAMSDVEADSPYAGVAFESRLALYQRLGRGAEAEQLAAHAADLSQRSVDFMRLGDIQTRLDKHGAAAASYAKALAAPEKSGAPERWALLMLHGNALAQAGDWPQAEASLRAAIELAPKEPSLLNFLGYSLLERRIKIAEAKDLIAQAAALKPEDPAITDSLGWAHFLSGDFDRAVDILEKAALAEPTEPTINEHLGDAYWRVGRKVEARYSWRAAALTAPEDAQARLAEKADFGLTDANMAK